MNEETREVGTTNLVEDLALSNAYQLEALINVLERKGIPTSKEVLDELEIIAARHSFIDHVIKAIVGALVLSAGFFISMLFVIISLVQVPFIVLGICPGRLRFQIKLSPNSTTILARLGPRRLMPNKL